jgi:prepilin-type N-terminal cleavage/methylation domain-containing protein/prepilin-type processing-associated H-X9-DG protein
MFRSNSLPPRSVRFSVSVRRGFTLVELLVVIAVITVLIGILLPALTAARRSSETIQCASNIRQILAAAMMYANDNAGFAPVAEFDGGSTNLQRWCGSRKTMADPFDFNANPSPLKSYLINGAIRTCPSLPDVLMVGVDTGAGGYGYEENYIGGSLYQYPDAYTVPPLFLGPPPSAYSTPAKFSQIRTSSNKVMFADTATGYNGGFGGGFFGHGLFQYSFVEAPLGPTGFPSWPSIHFRHNKRAANIGWADGHVTTENFGWTLAVNDPNNFYGIDFSSKNLGWFGPHDNTLFQRN